MVVGQSRRNIERKIEELEEQRDKGFITQEDYDTLKIRYERRLGNDEEVEKLQKIKGYSSKSKRKSEKDELFDEFVDKPSKKTKAYAEVVSEQASVGSTFKKVIITLFVIIAFAIGIYAGVTTLNLLNNETQMADGMVISDSAFSTQNSNNVASDANVSVVNSTKSKTSSNKVSTTTNSKKSSSTASSTSSSSNSNQNQKTKTSDSSSNSNGNSSGG
ncbi:MAG: hypothetical protein Q4Q23_06400 [Methanobacteriaceae archaeon]|nr:hypothetical protein [Methanobacteriaceae archaeon]